MMTLFLVIFKKNGCGELKIFASKLIFAEVALSPMISSMDLIRAGVAHPASPYWISVDSAPLQRKSILREKSSIPHSHFFKYGQKHH